MAELLGARVLTAQGVCRRAGPVRALRALTILVGFKAILHPTFGRSRKQDAEVGLGVQEVFYGTTPVKVTRTRKQQGQERLPATIHEGRLQSIRLKCPWFSENVAAYFPDGPHRSNTREGN